MQRALTPENIFNKKRKLYDLEGDWLNSFGAMERGSRIMAWGDSANGKSRFALDFLKYFKKFGKVLYYSLEMKDSLALEIALKEAGILSGITILKNEPIEVMEERLLKHKSPEIILFDSFQYIRNADGLPINYARYMEFSEKLANKTLFFLSHAEGKLPEGRVAKAVRYDVDIKIHVKGYKAFIKSRYGGGEPYIIWEQGAAEYWKEYKT